MAGVNQAGEELGSDSSCKHDKLQHLQSVLHSEGDHFFLEVIRLAIFCFLLMVTVGVCCLN